MSNKRFLFLTGVLVLLTAGSTACAGNTGNVENTEQETVVQTETPAETDTADEITANNEDVDEQEEAQLPDGIYQAEFTTDSSMFHVSEACDGKGTLTVENGQMTIHVSLASKKILNLYPGLAEDAKKDGAVLLEPTTDEVTYSDGMTEEVYGFDIPVPALDTEFDVALVGTKGTWYDHKVCVSNPVELTEGQTGDAETSAVNGDNPELADGSYSVEIVFEGGSGKASITSPVTLRVENRKMTAVFEWSSPNYDYMLVDGEKYLPVNKDGNSIFEIPVSSLDTPMEVVGDTVAMSTPHEIDYTITFRPDTIKALD